MKQARGLHSWLFHYNALFNISDIPCSNTIRAVSSTVFSYLATTYCEA
jgi:hypothetical protein